MNKSFLILIFSILSSSLFAQNSPSPLFKEGLIYHFDDQSQWIYRQTEQREQKKDNRIITHQYKDKENTLIAEEQITLEGETLIRYDSAINIKKQFGSVKRVGKTFEISFTDEKGSKTKIRKIKEPLVGGPMLMSFIMKNKERLVNDESVIFYLPYFDIQGLIPFKLVLKKKDYSPQTALIQMKLKNLILGLLIKPINIIIDKDSGQVLEIKGPTILPEPNLFHKKSMFKAQIYYYY